jgi:8-amino-7-oxononanoate synthase
VIDTLLQTARPYIFTTAAPPLLAETARVALQLIRNDRARYSHLNALIEHFRTRIMTLPWKLLPSQTPIQPLMVGDNASALALSAALWQRGFWVPAIRPPTVPAGTARLRITLTAAHTLDDVDALTTTLAELATACSPSHVQ